MKKASGFTEDAHDPVAVQNMTVDPRRTVGGFENDPQDGTYTEIGLVHLFDDTDVRLL